MSIIEIKVPSLGESVTEATVGKWLKKQGETAQADAVLVELETDKVTLEVYAPEDGTLTEAVATTGSTIKVGDVLAKFTPGKIEKTASTAKETIIEKTAAQAPAAVTTPEKSSAAQPPAAHSNEPHGQSNVAEFISSAAHKKTSTITGHTRDELRVPMSRLRQRIAERLKGAQNTAAILTTFNEIDMSAILQLRALYKDSFEKKLLSIMIEEQSGAVEACWAHNSEVRGSKPRSAITFCVNLNFKELFYYSYYYLYYVCAKNGSARSP